MPRVRLPNGKWLQCDFRTTAAAWRRQELSSVDREAACKNVIAELVVALDARCTTGDLADADFWPKLRQELAARIAADMQPAAAVEPAHQPPALA
jgi:hypothetical protein